MQPLQRRAAAHQIKDGAVCFGERSKMKIEMILLLYDRLLSGEDVSRREFCAEYSISERTFYRYLRAITDFLRVHKPMCFVDVLDCSGTYFLKK